MSVRPENTVMYLVGNRGENICGIFSETTPLWRSSTPSIDLHTCVKMQGFVGQGSCMQGEGTNRVKSRYVSTAEFVLARPFQLPHLH